MTENLYVPTVGRPRQPWCPDCKRLVPPQYNEKSPGQGYCKPHQSARVRKNYISRRDALATEPLERHPETRTQNLIADIKRELSAGRPMTPDFIRGLFHECALPEPSDEDIERVFFSDQQPAPRVNLLAPENEAEMIAELRRQAAEQNPYDPVD